MSTRGIRAEWTFLALDAIRAHHPHPIGTTLNVTPEECEPCFLLLREAWQVSTLEILVNRP